jgi:hypothetical protein
VAEPRAPTHENSEKSPDRIRLSPLLGMWRPLEAGIFEILPAAVLQQPPAVPLVASVRDRARYSRQLGVPPLERRRDAGRCPRWVAADTGEARQFRVGPGPVREPQSGSRKAGLRLIADSARSRKRDSGSPIAGRGLLPRSLHRNLAHLPRRGPVSGWHGSLGPGVRCSQPRITPDSHCSPGLCW